MPNNQDAVKLLPCPFCGGEAYEGYDDCSYGDYVECSDCLTKVRNLTFSSINPQPDAATVWQRRAPTPREQELEAQNKALWELVEATHILTKNLRDISTMKEQWIPMVALENAEQVLAAIQKAKESMK
jgi:hypothetical protein